MQTIPPLQPRERQRRVPGWKLEPNMGSESLPVPEALMQSGACTETAVSARDSKRGGQRLQLYFVHPSEWSSTPFTSSWYRGAGTPEMLHKSR